MAQSVNSQAAIALMSSSCFWTSKCSSQRKRAPHCPGTAWCRETARARTGQIQAHPPLQAISEDRGKVGAEEACSVAEQFLEVPGDPIRVRVRVRVRVKVRLEVPGDLFGWRRL